MMLNDGFDLFYPVWSGYYFRAGLKFVSVQKRIGVARNHGVHAALIPDSNLILTIIGSPIDSGSIILQILQQQHYPILDQPGAVISPGNDRRAAKRFRCPVVRDKIEFLVAVV